MKSEEISNERENKIRLIEYQKNQPHLANRRVILAV